jgi:hypothetical protein
MDGTDAGSVPADASADRERKPCDFDLPGRDWLIGDEPRGSQKWVLELRLRLQEMEQRLQVQEMEERFRQEWATGKRPENDREWQLEYTFRQLKKQAESEANQRQLQPGELGR